MKKDEVAEDIDSQLMVQINDLLEGEIPEAMYERQIDDEIRAFNYRLQSQGLKFDTYMQADWSKCSGLRQGFASKRKIK